tara:strand:- start:186 stop:710 length:525 start_codon:yes stop_codon:yes gene_type:complete
MKLNIGGEQKKEGWKILNIQKKEGVDFIGDISDLSQFNENSIDEIYASHIVEHVDQNKIKATLKGIHRILKDNGKFYISVPDMEVLCRIFLAKDAPNKVKFHAMRMMFGGQIDKYDYHYFGWNYEFLNIYLIEAGFKNLERVKSFGLFDDTSDFAPYDNGSGKVPISLNVIAYK